MDDAGPDRRFTRAQVERLMAIANRLGVSVEAKVEPIADAPGEEGAHAAPDGIEMAGRMRSDPGRSLCAQTRIDPGTLRMLKS